MKLIAFNQKENRVVVVPHSFEDLWTLKKIVKDGDVISASSTRVFETESGNKERKRVFIVIRADTVELSEYQNVLRLAGKIVAGQPEEYIQMGKYHSFNIQLNDEFGIIKEKGWTRFDIQTIKDAVKQTGKSKIHLLLIDDKTASLYALTDFGVKNIVSLQNTASKRDPGGMKEKTNKFFAEIVSVIEPIAKEAKLVVAGPGFANDSFFKFVNEKNAEIAKNIRLESCNTTEVSGINELMKKGVISKIVGEMQIENGTNAIERFLESLGKEDGFAVYGLKEVSEAVFSGALESLFLVDELVRKSEDAMNLLANAEKMKLDIVILNSETQPGKQLEKFGSVAGIRRYTIR